MQNSYGTGPIDLQILFRIGAISAITILLIYLIELVVVLIFGLPPTTIQEWFAMFQGNIHIALLRSFSLDILANIFHAPLFLALFFAIKHSRKSSPWLILAIIFALIGMGVYFASNTVFSLLYLSNQYAAAGTDAQRSMALTAGQATLAIYNGTGPFMAFTLYALAGLTVSIIMLKDENFSKITACAGIVGNTLQFGPPPGYGPDWFFKIDPILIGIGGVFLLAWLLLIAMHLFKFETDKSLNTI
jgi:hypothetical protein